MRLRVHTATANEELVALINEGYEAIAAMQASHSQRKQEGTYDDDNRAHLLEVTEPVDAWSNNVMGALGRIFPTQLEQHLFANPEVPFGAVSGDYHFNSSLVRCRA